MKIKRLIILAFALLMALSLVSCGETPDETQGGEDVSVVTGDLEFTSNGDGTCYVSGIGGYAGAFTVEIPEKSPAGSFRLPLRPYRRGTGGRCSAGQSRTGWRGTPGNCPR